MSNTTREGLNGRSSKASVLLWIVQGLLALLFLFAGGMKLVAPVDMLAQQTHLPGLFMKFIGLCEFLGGVGLILPGILHIREELTSWAAIGLVAIMSGATVITLQSGPAAPAAMPLVVGVLSALIAYGRKPASYRVISRR
jgi:DoxX-like protein